ncbi:probable ATP-dependent RNA helicase DDX49 [Antedon mediterranea]|uniref:probable ATP-dependent RNA helicase DDX49 n=1 Tax=Antedon mediterranea TaxID=105859 RepID=UPI003AF665A5
MASVVAKVDRENSFSTLKLDKWLVNQCKNLGLSRPTPIQKNCIPPILQGRDCIGCAKTGSGKTAAFVLPILQTLSVDPYGIYCLVLSPTRELAYQVADQFRVLGKPIGLKDCVVVGGMDMISQATELSKQPHVVVATPGRLADHLNSASTFSLKKIKFLVLDEADRLLEGNFGPDLEVIFDAITKKRQTLLFSATITQTLEELRKIAMKEPFFYECTSETEIATVDTLDQRYVLMPKQVKDAYLLYILQEYMAEHEDPSILIFTSTCKSCHAVAIMLRKMHLPCAALHSLVNQRTRLSALARFKSNQVNILIATDVASRGLDIPSVKLIINHNIPGSPKDYIHRVGRTARAGRGGMAISLVTQFDVELVQEIEERIKTKLVEYPVEEKEVLRILNEVAVAKREAELKLEEIDFGEKRKINKQKQLIREGKDPEEEETRKRKVWKEKRKLRKKGESSKR